MKTSLRSYRKEVRAEGDETSLQNQERRNYALNERKSMKKKLLETEKDYITVVHTGGGIKIELNAGTYELFNCKSRSKVSTI